MRGRELFRLVGLNINQNKFKSVMTSIGIVVGAATIVLVIGIGRGGQMEVAEQFAELNAGAIDVSYEYKGEEKNTDGFSFGDIGARFGRVFGDSASGNGMMNRKEMPDGGSMPGNGETPENGSTSENREVPENAGSSERPNSRNLDNVISDGNGEQQNPNKDIDGEETEEEKEEETGTVDGRMNQEKIILTEGDVEDIERYVQGITGATISYSTRASVEGADLTSAQSYTIAGVKESYADISKLTLKEGSFIEEQDDETKNKVCVLGATAAKELFGNQTEIAGETIYISERSYTVAGILEQTASVSAGISPDTSIFIPYETGIKYVTGEEISPVITVIAEDVTVLESAIEEVRTVLEENYNNTEFKFEDSGSKMQAAQASNRTLTMLLSAMAAIVFLIGGIGIMNVLFVSVRERTNEIGILKAIGTSRSSILAEFLMESAAISCIGGILGVALSFGIVLFAEYMDVRVEVNLFACITALGFAVLTGTVFGLYPAWKASRMEPVEALNAE